MPTSFVMKYLLHPFRKINFDLTAMRVVGYF